MKIILDQIEFEQEEGVRILKAALNECPFDEVKDLWDSVNAYSFNDILTVFTNVEKRRVALNTLGIEKVFENLEFELLSNETINKTISWIDQNEDYQTKEIKDTYELYKVPYEALFKGTVNDRSNNRYPDFHIVKFKDTSTNRVYILWVDMHSIKMEKYENNWLQVRNIPDSDISPIDAIAWTITTTVPKGEIEYIIRQGDCILVKTEYTGNGGFRHLSADEYRTLLLFES